MSSGQVTLIVQKFLEGKSVQHFALDLTESQHQLLKQRQVLDRDLDNPLFEQVDEAYSELYESIKFLKKWKTPMPIRNVYVIHELSF